MALDKGRILNELNSVMSQLQSADCGCMGKLFSNPNQQQQPMQMGCGNTGGCCRRRAPCQQAAAAAAPHCEHACNPVKMYTDTYDYLNTNLMQPTIKEIMDDFQGMNSSNTVTSSPGMGMDSAGGNAGCVPNMGMGTGNLRMGAMGAQGTMGMPNMSQGMGAQIMKMMNSSGNEKGKKAGNFSMGGTGDTGMSNADSMNAGTQNYMQGDHMAACHGCNKMHTVQNHINPMNMHGGMTGGGSHTMQGVPCMMQPVGQVPVEGGHPTMRGHNMNQHNTTGTNMEMNQISARNNNVRMAQNNMSQMHNRGRDPSHAMKESTMMTPPNATQSTMAVYGRINQVNPSQGNMGQGHMNHRNFPQSGNVNPNIPQPNTNVPSSKVAQGNTINSPHLGNMNVGAPNHTSRRCCGRGNAQSKGITFNQMFPGAMQGADGGELGFDPMAIAWQMNPNNKKMAAIQTMNNLMSNNKGFSKYMHNFMGNSLQTADAQSIQAPSAANAAEVSQPPVQESIQAPQTGDPNSVNAESNELRSQPVSPPNRAADGQGGAPTAAPIIRDPIHPAETKTQPPRPPKEQYDFNTLGQPVQLIPSDRYKLPQTLSQFPSPKPAPYSPVKSTISKTSIPRRSTLRIPSRARVDLNRGTVSATGPSAKAPTHGGSHSDGRLHELQQRTLKEVPIEAISNVAGDATSGQENAIPIKAEDYKGLPEGTPKNEPSGSLSRGKHNGLQDRDFTQCPNSSWSFGTRGLPYPHHYIPPPPQRVARGRY